MVNTEATPVPWGYIVKDDLIDQSLTAEPYIDLWKPYNTAKTAENIYQYNYQLLQQVPQQTTQQVAGQINANNPPWINPSDYFWTSLDVNKPTFGIGMTENQIEASISPKLTPIKTGSPVPQNVLDMVKDSTPDDWYQKNPAIGYSGWIHKTAKVSGSAAIMGNAIICKNAIVGISYVYDNAVVEEGATIGGGCYISANAVICMGAVVGNHSIVRNTAKIKGTVGEYCTISGKTVIKFGTHVPDHTTVMETPVEYRTQKARGISVLKNSGFEVPDSKLYRIEHLKTKTQLEKLVGKFVRPCPVTPRHGFVDSRPITSVDEARSLVKETKLADKLAEFVVMPFIDAPYSGIWTDGQLCVGKGTDGATSGKNSTTIPILGQPESKVEWAELLKRAGVKQSPYIELLWTKKDYEDYDSDEGEYIKRCKYKTSFVQLRDGPKLPNSVDFIPEKMEVKQVVKAEGDLLAWESLVKTFTPGTVIHHPGGSLASHYSVHAFLSGIPVVVSYEPKIGDVLEPNTTTPKANIDDMRRGFQIGLSIDCSYAQAAYMMMTGCHSTTIWLGRQDLFLGIAMGCCYRLLVAASLGEFRRYDNNILGKHNSIGSRDGVYQKVWNKIGDKNITKKFVAAMKSYDEDYWGVSIGGANWYVLSRWGAVLVNALIDGDEKVALDALNKGTNSVHNGGWTFNKFINHSEMDKTAKNPIYALLQVAPFFYDSLTLQDIKTYELVKFDVKDINPEEYLEDKKNNPNPKKIIKKADTTKKCCSSDCCGNPDCSECHPVSILKTTSIVTSTVKILHTSCPWFDDSHDGPDTYLQVKSGGEIFVACEKHKKKYLKNSFYALYEQPKVKLDFNSCQHNTDNCLHNGAGLIITNGEINNPTCAAHLQSYLYSGWNIVNNKQVDETLNEALKGLDEVLNETNKIEPPQGKVCECGNVDCEYGIEGEDSDKDSDYEEEEL